MKKAVISGIMRVGKTRGLSTISNVLEYNIIDDMDRNVDEVYEMTRYRGISTDEKDSAIALYDDYSSLSGDKVSM